MLRTVAAVRYVTPFKEGGSLPGLVEADDDGLYVVKFRGAGQGSKVLIAELLCGELARAVGLNVPELVWIELDAALGRAEPDSEIRELLKASVGRNLALDYLPGSITFDPVAGPAPDPKLAAEIVLFDSLVLNIDRTPRNPNMLSWHGGLWLIDHGAALYFHHSWSAENALPGVSNPFPPVKDHVLLPFARDFDAAATRLQTALSDAFIDEATAAIPDEFLAGPRDGFPEVSAHRSAYAAWLRARREAIPAVLEEAKRARALLV